MNTFNSTSVTFLRELQCVFVAVFLASLAQFVEVTSKITWKRRWPWSPDCTIYVFQALMVVLLLLRLSAPFLLIMGG